MFSNFCRPDLKDYEEGINRKINEGDMTTRRRRNLNRYVRPVDALERFWDALHTTGNLMIINSVVVRSSKPISFKLVSCAARVMMSAHQTLRVRMVSIMNHDQTRCEKFYYEMPHPALPSVKQSEFSTFDELMIYEQNFPFDTENGPLWRLRVISSEKTHPDTDKPYTTTIVAFFHHSIMDGMARQEFWNEFLETIEDVSRAANEAADNATNRAIENTSRSRNIPCEEAARLLGEPLKEDGFYDDVANDMATANHMDTEAELASDDLANITEEELAAIVSGDTSVVKTRIPGTITQYVRPTAIVAIARVLHRTRVGWAGSWIMRQGLARLTNPIMHDIPALNVADEKMIATRLLPLHLTSALSKKILAVCKANKMTVNSLLTAVAASGLVQLVRKYKDRQFPLAKWFSCLDPASVFSKTVSFDTYQAVSTRRWCPDNFTAAAAPGKTQTKNPQQQKQQQLQIDSQSSSEKSKTCNHIVITPAHQGAVQLPPPPTVLPSTTAVKPIHRPPVTFNIATRTHKNPIQLSSPFFLPASPKTCQNLTSYTRSHSRRTNRSRTFHTPISVLKGPSFLLESPKSCEHNQAANQSHLPILFNKSTLPPKTTTTTTNSHSLPPISNSPTMVSFKDDKRTPGLGSYAVLLPLRVSVHGSGLLLDEVLKSASSVGGNLKSQVDVEDPSTVTQDWQIMCEHVSEHAAIGNLNVVRDLTGSNPRPSIFLISNTGVWSTKKKAEIENGGNNSNDTNSAATAALAVKVIKCELESSWSCVVQHQSGNSLFAHNITSVQGRICWSLQYHTNMTCQSFVKEYSDGMLDLLNDLCKQQEERNKLNPPVQINEQIKEKAPTINNSNDNTEKQDKGHQTDENTNDKNNTTTLTNNKPSNTYRQTEIASVPSFRLISTPEQHTTNLLLTKHTSNIGTPPSYQPRLAKAEPKNVNVIDLQATSTQASFSPRLKSPGPISSSPLSTNE